MPPRKEANTLAVATHLALTIIAILSFVGFYFEMLFVQDSANANQLYHWSTCTVLALVCSGNTSLNYGCILYGEVDTEFGASNFTMSEFEDYTWKEVQEEFTSGSTFDCLYNRDDPSADVLQYAPLITEHYILYEYLLSIFIGILLGYSFKGAIYLHFQKNFVPEDGWAEAVENLWDSKARDNLRLPFSSSIILDMCFAMIVFTCLSFVDVDSLNHAYGFCVIMILSVFGAFEKHPNPSFLLKTECKINYLISNFALAFSWSLINMISKLILCFVDPFPRLVAYLVTFFAFFIYFVFKGAFVLQAMNLLTMYYSNALVVAQEENMKWLRNSKVQ